MGEDDYAVLRKMQIRLDGMRTHGYSTAEGAHGILRIRGLVATMGDSLRQLPGRAVARIDIESTGKWRWNMILVADDIYCEEPVRDAGGSWAGKIHRPAG